MKDNLNDLKTGILALQEEITSIKDSDRLRKGLLKDEIKEATQQLESTLTGKFCQIGFKLIRAKQITAHKEFVNWANNELKLSKSARHRYMKVAVFVEQRGFIPKIGLLAFDSYLASNDECKKEVESLFEQGVYVSQKDIARLRLKHEGKPMVSPYKSSVKRIKTLTDYLVKIKQHLTKQELLNLKDELDEMIVIISEKCINYRHIGEDSSK
jgi:hypothetical protein